jgi:transposase
MVNAAYGDKAISRSNVFRWYGRFRDGREDSEDDPRSGRPTDFRNDNNVEKNFQFLLQTVTFRQECYQTMWTLASTQ